MNLKGFVYRELGEGLTEEELADELPQDRTTWEHFARYFCVDVDFLQIGGPPHSEELFDLKESANPSPLGQMRKVPLLRWDQVDQMVIPEVPSRVIQVEAILETDVPGIRTFAMQVKAPGGSPLKAAQGNRRADQTPSAQPEVCRPLHDEPTAYLGTSCTVAEECVKNMVRVEHWRPPSL